MYICVNPNSEYDYRPRVDCYYEPSYDKGSRANFLDKLRLLDLDKNTKHYVYSNGEPSARLDMALDAAKSIGLDVEKVQDKNPKYTNADPIFHAHPWREIELRNTTFDKIQALADTILPQFKTLSTYEVMHGHLKLGYLKSANNTQDWYVYSPKLFETDLTAEHKHICHIYDEVYQSLARDFKENLNGVDLSGVIDQKTGTFKNAFMRFIIYTQEVNSYLHNPHADFCTFTMFVYQSKHGLRFYTQGEQDLITMGKDKALLIPSVLYPETFLTQTSGLYHDVIPVDRTFDDVQRWALTLHIM